MHVKRQCIGDGVRTAQMSTERPLHQCTTKTRLCHSCTPVEPLTNLASRAPQRSENTSLEKTIVLAGGCEDLFPESNCVDPIEDGGLWTASSARLPAEDVEKAAALSNRDTHFTSKSGTTYCFGMLLASLALFSQSKSASNLLLRIGSKVMLQLRFRVDGVSVLLPTTDDELGVLDMKTANALTTVMAVDPTITFEPYFYWKDERDLIPQPSKIFSVSINIYGDVAKLEEVGSTLSTACLYLQEPPSFNRDFVYRNPHVLSWPSEKTPTFLEDQDSIKIDISNDIDLILNESAPVNVPSTLTQYPSISTPLKPHQLAALEFMLTRELGSSSSEEYSMWVPEYHGLRVLFKHKITQIRQARMTLKCRGGILADEMGMGKSLTLLSLIAHTLKEAQIFGESQRNTIMERETEGVTKATLLIAPKSTSYGWQMQVKEHTLPGSINMQLYHGPKRNATLKQLANADIVLTTFETVSSDFVASETLRNISWFRIVLDEAHYIRNRATRTFQAIEDLMTERRWCLTGTPVQNKLDDLFSLTQFLRFHPLENHSNARKYILEPLGRQDKSAVTNLRLAMQTIALRRTKNASTSKRRDKIVIEIELSPRERQHYVSVRDRMRQLTLDSKTPQSHALLLCILYLRQLCSHGKPSLSPAPSRHMSENPHAGTPFCNKCGDLISVNPKSANQESRTCGHKVCAECRLEEKSIIDGDSNSFALLLQCCVCQEPITSGTLKGKELNDQTLKSLLGDNSSEMLDASLNPRFSSKIQGVVDKLVELNSEINIETGEPVKSLVFSHWGKTLKSLEIALRECNLRFLKIDGSLTLEQRGAVLLQFKMEPDIKILLLTYASGSTGLNLAMASRAHLLEPHWNPMVEAQAAARIDRLDQDKDIIIYHYVVKQSIEEHILQRQRNKVILAELSLSKTPSNDHAVDAKRTKGLESLLE